MAPLSILDPWTPLNNLYSLDIIDTHDSITDWFDSSDVLYFLQYDPQMPPDYVITQAWNKPENDPLATF